MDTLTRTHWDHLAVLVARAVEASQGATLPDIVVGLERAVGIADLDATDPAPVVTARRFARVHAAAFRLGRAGDARVRMLVQQGIAALTCAPASDPASGDEAITVSTPLSRRAPRLPATP